MGKRKKNIDDSQWSELVKSLEEPYNQFLKAQREGDELKILELEAHIIGRIEREAARPLFPSDAVGYILVDGEVVGLADAECYGLWMLFADIVVGETELPDGTLVLTIFLGAHGVLPGQAVFVTRIIKGRRNELKERYATWAVAEAGHQRWVESAANEPMKARSRKRKAPGGS